MLQDRVEEYLGAIYRLRSSAEEPLPLSQLTEYFGFSPVSIHEMIRKLDDGGWVNFHPYRGVTLTEAGEASARALLRRHRLWERFLTDSLDIPWDEAHAIAGDLEHAAPELVTERLAEFMGDPDACPHGGPIPPAARQSQEWCLRSLGTGAEARVTRISPETSALLKRVAALNLVPGRRLRIVEQTETETKVELQGALAPALSVPNADAQAIWVELM
jgi:DtxR family transcriptional regulator, Mn-dependent transcriptional regulator